MWPWSFLEDGLRWLPSPSFCMYQYSQDYNKVVDCLLRYYESNTSSDLHEFHDYVQANRRIDPEGENLSMERLQEVRERVVEIWAMHAMETRRRIRLRETQERREEEADTMRRPEPSKGNEEQHAPIDSD